MDMDLMDFMDMIDKMDFLNYVVIGLNLLLVTCKFFVL